jgi:hypothetical protein
MTFQEGVDEIIERTVRYINQSKLTPAATFVIDCGSEIDAVAIQKLEFIVRELDRMKEPLEPMQIEIFAAAQKLGVAEKELPCAAVVNPGNYRRKAVKQASAPAVVIMDLETLPTMTQIHFLQRGIPRDLVFYFANYSYRKSASEVQGETNASLASFAMVTDCESDVPKPQDLAFIIATKDTWRAVKVPPDGVNVNDWLMRFVPGYVAVRFESPVWRWGPPIEPIPSNVTVCEAGTAASGRASTIKGETVVYAGKRPEIN